MFVEMYPEDKNSKKFPRCIARSEDTFYEVI